MKHPATPELDKQHEAIEHGAAHRIGEFIDWLREQGYILAKYDAVDDLYDTNMPPKDLLADYFKIDLAKIEQEKRALLDHIRQQGEPK